MCYSHEQKREKSLMVNRHERSQVCIYNRYIYILYNRKATALYYEKKRPRRQNAREERIQGLRHKTIHIALTVVMKSQRAVSPIYFDHTCTRATLTLSRVERVSSPHYIFLSRILYSLLNFFFFIITLSNYHNDITKFLCNSYSTSSSPLYYNAPARTSALGNIFFIVIARKQRHVMRNYIQKSFFLSFYVFYANSTTI